VLVRGFEHEIDPMSDAPGLSLWIAGRASRTWPEEVNEAGNSPLHQEDHGTCDGKKGSG
jgi:hypothetical protein